jgi:DNA-binding NarL/FixJ family response regulator
MRKVREQPPVYRRVFLMMRAGKSQVEIAEELGVNPRTVRRIMFQLVRETIT